MLREGGIYVLNGSKPAVLGDFSSPNLRELPFFGGRFFKKEVMLKRGLEIWRKYQHLFPSANHVLLFHEKDDLFEILLINKKRFLNEVARNIEDFKAILGSEMTAEILLKKLVKQEEPLSEILKNHSGLLGIILGYGKHNSWLFHQRKMIQNRLDNSQFIPKRFDLIKGEFNTIDKKFQPIEQKRKSILFFTSLPSFVFDPLHIETHELWKEYRKQRKELTKTYRNKNFLEFALKKYLD